MPVCGLHLTSHVLPYPIFQLHPCPAQLCTCPVSVICPALPVPYSCPALILPLPCPTLSLSSANAPALPCLCPLQMRLPCPVLFLPLHAPPLPCPALSCSALSRPCNGFPCTVSAPVPALHYSSFALFLPCPTPALPGPSLDLPMPCPAFALPQPLFLLCPVLPMWSAEAERLLSKLRKVKSWLRSTGREPSVRPTCLPCPPADARQGGHRSRDEVLHRHRWQPKEGIR